MIGQTVSQDDLAPRQKGVHLAPPCRARAATSQSFDGYHRGQIVLGRTRPQSTRVSSVTATPVSGSYSYGAGFGRLKGEVRGIR